ncbi:hypothetical protein BpHYR1_053799 [Brachionus plicatilis]|uniref:Uncharacterized protein n=1 Tax=Brachionus plicatilis TaxID=10195 RepID=A0A3M7TCL3_BRAPC|nr:hypothetical protein BpHYR1_053799 [Brachionus plicatilis]
MRNDNSHLVWTIRNTGGQLKKYMDNKIKNLSTNQTYMIVHGQLSGKGTRPEFYLFVEAFN